ncbi:MAG: restriction endonuclease subunit S [Chitinophagaceae bacterium]
MNEVQNIKQLPKDWKWVTFNDVCIKIGDIDHKMPKQLLTGYPYVSTKDFTDDLKISFNRAKYISEEDYLNLSRKIKPEKGDIIFPRYGTIGKNILIDFDKEFLVSYSCAIVKPNNDLVLSKYAYLYSLSPRVSKEIEKYVVETTQANIGIASIKRFVFPLPPKPTQAAIVSKIEELFSELDKGIENLHTAQQQLKTYRQSVLKWAFEGRLTNENVKEGELPKGWKLTKLGEYIENISSGKSYRCDERPPGKDEIGIVKVSSVTWGFFDEMESKTCFSKDFLNEKYLIEKGDLLFSRANTIEFIGACVIVHKIDKKLMLSDKILRFTLSKHVSKEYALYYLRSRKGRKQIETLSTGNQDSMRNIGQEKIRQIEFPYSSLKEQNNTVQAIESRLSVADKIEETITQSLQQAEALRQSILKKAFEGRLV